MGRIHPRQHWDGLYSPPPGNSCALPRLKSQIRPRIGPGCGCRGLGSGWVERWGARRDVDRWLPRGAGARAALGRLVLTSSRKLLHRSPVKVAVPATNRVGLRLPGGGLGRGWGIGALVDEFKRAARRDVHGREARVCARARGAVGWTALPTKSGVRYFPSIQKLASKARRPNRVATAPTRHRPRGAGRPPPPRTPRARRTALVRPSVVALIPGSPPPVVQAVHWVTA